MCGIAGIIRFGIKDGNLASDLIGMSKRISHRGPDDEGFLIKADQNMFLFGSETTPENVLAAGLPYTPYTRQIHVSEAQFGFAHRRLSIIDLSPYGHQPLSYKDRYWIVFNGEIYNYKELKKELESLGETFISETDTEVILAAYHIWGFGCFRKFNGMWSLMIYDNLTKSFIASRDRYGVKPFYYIESDSYLCFASEQKAFLDLPYFTKEVNATEVFDFFLLNKFESKEEGFFKGMKELKAGHYFTFHESGKDRIISKYVEEPSFYSLHIDDDKASEQTLQYLTDSVSMRLRSDVPVGSCLSGGIDSSAIVTLMHKLQPENRLHVFTASFPGSSIDETNYARLVAEQTGSYWHTVTPTSDDLLRDLEELIYCQDIPIWSTSTYAQFRVMKLVKDAGIKVILDGQGGDELFAGYHTYYYPFWKSLLHSGRISELLKELKGFGEGAMKHYFRLLLKERLVPSLTPDLQLKTYLSIYPELGYLDKDFLNEHKYLLADNHSLAGSLSESLYREYYGERLKGYLKCEDRCAMNFSVESRVPFADDPQLAQFVFSLPDSLKIRNGINKYVLRKSLNGIVPEKILNRKDKMGYVTPNNRWISEIKDSLRDYFTADLDPYFNREKLLKEYDQLFDPKGEIDTGRVFKFISFAVWMKLHFSKA